MTTLKTGDRVTLIKRVEHYPLGIWPIGTTGTIASIADNVNGETGHTYWVRLDKHDPVLTEWQNELQVDVSDDQPMPLALLPR